MNSKDASSPFRGAIVRKPGPNCGQGLTTSGLGLPDFPLLLRQHEKYVSILEEWGLEIVSLPPEPSFPDAYFVEDTAVITPTIAVITRPGAPARRGEERSIAAAMSPYRPLVRIEPPGTLEGGDVLEADGRYFIGLSERTNEDGARQLGRILEADGRAWTLIPVEKGLHLKSSVNGLGGNALIVTEDLANLQVFDTYRKIILEPAEAYAANVLAINGRLLLPAGCPSVWKKLEPLGLPIREIDVSEVRKMDGGLTCMSLRF